MNIEEYKEKVINADTSEELEILLKSYKKVWCIVTEQSFWDFMNKVYINDDYNKYIQSFKSAIIKWIELETSDFGTLVRKKLDLNKLEEIKLIK